MLDYNLGIIYKNTIVDQHGTFNGSDSILLLLFVGHRCERDRNDRNLSIYVTKSLDKFAFIKFIDSKRSIEREKIP